MASSKDQTPAPQRHLSESSDYSTYQLYIEIATATYREKDMSHNHSHGGCHDESHSHDHDHDLPENIGPRDNLFLRIDRANVVAMNAEEPGKGPEVIKPWDKRLDEEIVRYSLICGRSTLTSCSRLAVSRV